MRYQNLKWALLITHIENEVRILLYSFDKNCYTAKFALCLSFQILYRNEYLFIKILDQIIRIKIQFAGKER